MSSEFAPRVLGLEPEGAYHMLARAQQLEASGRSIIHFEIGQPDAPTFSHIAQAGMAAIELGYTRYTPTAGIPALREAIAAQASSQRCMQIKPSQVVVGPGAKPALFFPTLAVVRPGDEVIYPDPGFPTYPAMIEVAGGVPVPIPLREESDFAFDMAAFHQAINPRTRMIVINSPSNPTGGVMSLESLEQVAQVAREHRIWVLSDEIYTRLIYDTPAPSIAMLEGMQDLTIICDGFSKTYAMTGWRLGYGIMPEALAERVELLLTHAVGSTADFTQRAGLVALEGPQEKVGEVLVEYRRRRDLLVAGLNAIPGVRCRLPQGAFYAFPNISAFGKTSDWIANYLLEEAGVALLPGTAFGRFGEGYLRLCFASSIENIQTALGRMQEALTKLKLK
jgi:aspartate aminotransferase